MADLTSSESNLLWKGFKLDERLNEAKHLSHIDHNTCDSVNSLSK